MAVKRGKLLTGLYEDLHGAVLDVTVIVVCDVDMLCRCKKTTNCQADVVV